MKKRIWAFAIPVVILLAVFLVPSLLTSQSAVMDKPSKEDVALKMQSIQIPFVANNGQVDAQVKFYANTFGGTVFVTKDGEIVYSLPKVGAGFPRPYRTEGGRKNVEKLFCVKPDANPDQIQVMLSGAKGLRVNDEGQLEAETELGPVKFTKPVAYQEIDGKRVAVTVEYRVESLECGVKNSKLEIKQQNSRIPNSQTHLQF